MPTIPTRFLLYNPTTGEWDEYKRYTVDDITGLAKVETSLPDLQEYLMNGSCIAGLKGWAPPTAMPTSTYRRSSWKGGWNDAGS